MTGVGLFVAGWHYADEVLRPEPAELPVYDVMVAAVGDGTVTLERTPDSALPGVWGLDWPDGYARVTDVVAEDDATVTRRLVPVVGELAADERVRVDANAYPADPDQAFYFPTQQVTVEGPDGGLPADLVVPDVVAPDEERTRWRTGGPRDTWAVLVHGRGASRAEAYRLVPALRSLGLPSLVVSYRNDPDAPPDPEGRYGLGWTEWRDLDAATDYAFENGAQEVVLVGFSMGGAVVMSYLHESGDADRVAAVVLDAPVLDWDRVLREAAAERGVPGWLVPVARGVITLRTGIRWRGLDQVRRAGELEVPVLVHHGTADEVVPLETSRAFAAARPELVELAAVDGAGHVRSWNRDPPAYEARLADFLTGVLD